MTPPCTRRRMMRGRDAIGRYRDEQRFDAEGQDLVHVRIGHHAHQVGIVRAAPLGRQERPFEMDAEAAERRAGDRLLDRGDRLGGDLRRIRDQGRQQRRGAEAGMRIADRAHALRGRRIVEQHAAAAIDLRIDEARRQHAALQTMHRQVARHHCLRHHVEDARAVDHDGVLRAPLGAVEDLRACDREPGHHKVSVTFLRRGGVSGSKPRARAIRSTVA